jgi:hypothetical protein
MKPIYRVIKNTYYKKCTETGAHYTIQKKMRFLFFKWWESVTEVNNDDVNSYRTVISFKTEAEAVFAIKKLEMGNKPNGWRKEVSVVLDFNKKSKG